MAPSFTIALKNGTKSNDAYAYVTGTGIERNALYFLDANGKDVWYAPKPPKIGSPLGHECAIKLGGPGAVSNVTIPLTQSGRIYFSIGKLTFKLDPTPNGAAVVQPSVTNPSDPNYYTNYSFMEFTWNTSQLFANISFVDFVGLPVSMELNTKGNKTQKVSGIPNGGIATICKKLEALPQKQWGKLVVKDKQGGYLRAISPNLGLVMFPNDFREYYKDYVNKVWQKYEKDTLSVNTQMTAGTVKGKVEGGVFKLGGHAFNKPSTADILSCSTGPFTPSGDLARGAIIARLCAAFHRSTLLTDTRTPDPDGRKDYYKDGTTNYYSKVVHEVSSDGKGYAFPFDDVQADNGPDQSGMVAAGDPKTWTITVGQ